MDPPSAGRLGVKRRDEFEMRRQTKLPTYKARSPLRRQDCPTGRRVGPACRRQARRILNATTDKAKNGGPPSARKRRTQIPRKVGPIRHGGLKMRSHLQRRQIQRQRRPTTTRVGPDYRQAGRRTPYNTAAEERGLRSKVLSYRRRSRGAAPDDSLSENSFRPLQGKGIGHPRCILQVDNFRLA
jgi:hypothetical protein